MATTLVLLDAGQRESSRSNASPEVASEAEARAVLAATFEAARSGDVEAFCADSEARGTCESQWSQMGGEAGVPRTMPRVVAVRVQDGFRVLTICGTDGTGETYQSDFPVRKRDGRITAPLPVFWYGVPFGGRHGDGEPTTVTVDPTNEPVAC